MTRAVRAHRHGGVLAEMLATLSRHAHAATTLRPLCGAALKELRRAARAARRSAGRSGPRPAQRRARRNADPLRAALAGVTARRRAPTRETIAEWARLLDDALARRDLPA
jgi:hypothetical protein